MKNTIACGTPCTVLEVLWIRKNHLLVSGDFVGILQIILQLLKTVLSWMSHELLDQFKPKELYVRFNTP